MRRCCGLVVIALSLFPIAAIGDIVSFECGCVAPRDIVVTPDNEYMYVACANGGNGVVTVVRLSDYAIVDSIWVGYDPLEIGITPDGQHVYVTNTVNGYYTTKISTVSNTKLKEIRGGTDPAGIAFSPDGSKAYITNHWTPALQVISVAADDQIAWISGISHGAYSVVISPDGRYAYVTARLTGQNPGQGVYKISLLSQSVVAVVPIGGDGIDITPDGTEVWVAGHVDFDTSTVYVVSTLDDTVLDSIGVGQFPNDIKISADGMYAYVVCSLDSSLMKISVPDRVVEGCIKVGRLGRRIELRSNDSRIFVANTGDDYITEVHRDDFHGCVHLPIRVHLDIKPGSCPNPLNIQGLSPVNDFEYGNTVLNSNTKVRPDGQIQRRGILPAAILGTGDFDVSEINPVSLKIMGVSPIRWNYEDVSTPVYEPSYECECNDLGGDDFTDLTIKFDEWDVVNGIGEVSVGDTVVLTITGELYDGTPIEGSDCVVIVGGGPPTSDYDGEDGEIITEREGAGLLPSDFALYQNRPNPFNPVTDISFSLPEASRVNLDIYNITGQKVATLIDGRLEAGNHDVVWDGSDASSGIYLYRLKAGEFMQTRRMVLLK